MKKNFINKYIIIKTRENKIELYEDKHKIKELFDIAFGKNGLSSNKKEGDLTTPIGIFNISFAFGTEKITCNLPFYIINENDYWITDSNSKYYNEFIRLTTDKEYNDNYIYYVSKPDWKNFEHLIDYKDDYKLALVIEYNKNPKIKEAGSAIFLHIKTKKATSGCLATTESNLKYIIKWLGKEKTKIIIQ